MPPKRKETGWVGVLAQDAARFSQFGLCLGRLELPTGWELHGALNFDAAHASNWLAENFVGDRLLLLGDDHTFQPDLVHKLLRHDVDVVAPFVLGRRVPFRPVCEPHLLDRNPGLHRVQTTGSAGMMIRRSVFERLAFPYFWHGTTDDGYVAEDTHFCELLTAAGIPIYVDTTVCLGHMLVGNVLPEYQHGHWQRKAQLHEWEVEIR